MEIYDYEKENKYAPRRGLTREQLEQQWLAEHPIGPARTAKDAKRIMESQQKSWFERHAAMLSMGIALVFAALCLGLWFFGYDIVIPALVGILIYQAFSTSMMIAVM